jgi:hypothetical protein
MVCHIKNQIDWGITADYQKDQIIKLTMHTSANRSDYLWWIKLPIQTTSKNNHLLAHSHLHTSSANYLHTGNAMRTTVATMHRFFAQFQQDKRTSQTAQHEQGKGELRYEKKTYSTVELRGNGLIGKNRWKGTTQEVLSRRTKDHLDRQVLRCVPGRDSIMELQETLVKTNKVSESKTERLQQVWSKLQVHFT